MTQIDCFDAILGKHLSKSLSKKVCRTLNATGFKTSKTFLLITALPRRPLWFKKAGNQHPGSDLTHCLIWGRGRSFVSSLTTRYEPAVSAQKRVCQGRLRSI